MNLAARHPGYYICINTLIDGPVAVEHDRNGNPVVYASLLEAQRVIAEDAIDRLGQFLEGQREFDDALTVEEYVVEVAVMADGSVICVHPC